LLARSRIALVAARAFFFTGDCLEDGFDRNFLAAAVDASEGLLGAAALLAVFDWDTVTDHTRTQISTG
jgi:hypothetical protein